MSYELNFLLSSHEGSSNHKDEIMSGAKCGCFYCIAVFSPTEIEEWINETPTGETAICPKCGIESVLSNKYPIENKGFLQAMHSLWF